MILLCFFEGAKHFQTQ